MGWDLVMDGWDLSGLFGVVFYTGRFVTFSLAWYLACKHGIWSLGMMMLTDWMDHRVGEGECRGFVDDKYSVCSRGLEGETDVAMSYIHICEKLKYS